MIQIYHNPRCSKSRQCLAFAQESGIDYEVIDYLNNSPNFEELKVLLSKLDLPALALVRQSEKVWIENFKGRELSEDDIIKAMVSHPILIQRPIVINGDYAVIARPIDLITTII